MLLLSGVTVLPDVIIKVCLAILNELKTPLRSKRWETVRGFCFDEKLLRRNYVGTFGVVFCMHTAVEYKIL